MKSHVFLYFLFNLFILVCYRIYCGELIIKEEIFDNEIQLDYLFNPSKNENTRDPNILKIMKTMKLKEKSSTAIKLAAFQSITNISNRVDLLESFGQKESLKIIIDVNKKNS